MAAFSKFNVFTTELTAASHNFASDSFKVLLTNTALSAATATKAAITEVASGNGYTTGGNATTITKSNASGTEKITGSVPTTWTASGGTMGPFQYAVLWNATSSKIVGYWDYGTAVTLAIGETFTVSLDTTNGIFTVA